MKNNFKIQENTVRIRMQIQRYLQKSKVKASR
jgi:hypothetical protein